MSKINCPVCGTSLEQSNVVCDRCGWQNPNDIKQKPTNINKVLIISLSTLALLIILLVGCLATGVISFDKDINNDVSNDSNNIILESNYNCTEKKEDNNISKSGIVFKQLVMTTALDSKNRNSNVVNSYPSNAEAFYITGLYEGAPLNTSIKIAWLFEGNMIDWVKLDMQNNTEGSFYSSLPRTEKKWPLGVYNVEVYINDELSPASIISFEVLDSKKEILIPYVKNLITCSAIDDNGKNIDEVYEFEIGDIVYTVFDIYDANEDTTILIRWIDLTREQELAQYETRAEGKKHFWSFYPQEGIIEQGDYRVEIYLDDSNIPSLDVGFTVSEEKIYSASMYSYLPPENIKKRFACNFTDGSDGFEIISSVVCPAIQDQKNNYIITSKLEVENAGLPYYCHYLSQGNGIFYLDNSQFMGEDNSYTQFLQGELEEGTTFCDPNQTSTILKVGMDVSVGPNTYSNCIAVERYYEVVDYNEVRFYAPDIGLILVKPSLDSEDSYMELISINSMTEDEVQSTIDEITAEIVS